MLLSIACLLWTNNSNSQLLHRSEFSEVQMGTLFRIVIYAETISKAEAASEKAFHRIEELI